MRDKELLKRMEYLLPRLPKTFLSDFLRVNTKYDTYKGRNKIEAVVALRLADRDIIELLEKQLNRLL